MDTSALHISCENGFCSKLANSTKASPNGHSTICKSENGNKKVYSRRTMQHEPPPVASDADVSQYAQELPIPDIYAVLCDPANLCTLLGATMATLAMVAMWKGSYALGITLNMIANLGDILDGPIARSLKNRHSSFSLIGGNMDTYSDIVSHFLVPASLLMHLSNMDIFYVGLAIMWIITGIVRYSYIEVVKSCDDGTCIIGVTSNYMVPLCALFLHLVPILGQANVDNYVVPMLAVCVVFMIFASLTFALKSRRYSGWGLFSVTFFNMSLAITCFLMWFWGSFCGQHKQVNIWSFEGFSFIYHLVLAYPCYYRFVEIN